MTTEYNNKLCEERHAAIEKELSILFQKSENLDKLLNGNGNGIGWRSKMDRIWDWYQRQSATQAGMLDWFFRSLITLLLGYIAVKVGLK